MRAVLGLVVLAGCSRIFGFEQPTVGTEDASPDTAPPRPARCSTFNSFIDTFDDSLLGSQWAVQAAGPDDSIATSNGELHLQANGTSSFLALRTRAMYRFDEAAFTIQLPRVESDVFTGANQVLVFLRAADSFQFELTISNGQLTATRTGGVPPLVVGQVEYDPDRSRFLRFERIDGNLHARDSSDGIVFRTIGMVAEDVPVARAFVGILRDPASPASLVLDLADVNANVTPDQVCSPVDFIESFDSELSPLQWETDLDQCTIELDGRLRINSNKTFRCSITSAVPYDLQLGSFTVEVPPATDLGNGQLGISLEIANNVNPAFSLSGNSLQATFNGVLANATYDPNAHRFLRFRVVGAALQWETSADGVDFTVFASTGAVAGLGRARLALTLDSLNDVATVSIAGVNAP